MKQLTRRTLLAASGSLITSSLVGPAHAESLVVIVHPSVKSNLSDAELAAVFTTRKKNWSDGSRIVPFNFPAKHDVRIAFDKKVLSMGPDEVARYWIDRRIRGGNPPPKQVPSGVMIAKLIQRLEGSIAYIPESNAPSGVRVVRHL